jgi:hypothetical protein
MKIFIVPISLFFLATTACIPSRTMVDINEQVEAENFNDQINGHAFKLRTVDGQEFIPESIQFSKDSVRYVIYNEDFALPISIIESLSVSKKPSLAKAIAIPLFALGVFGIASFDDSGAIGPEIGKVLVGSISLISGAVTLVVGSTLETNTYIFNH